MVIGRYDVFHFVGFLGYGFEGLGGGVVEVCWVFFFFENARLRGK